MTNSKTYNEEYYKKNKERLKEYRKEYYKKRKELHPDYYKKYGKVYNMKKGEKLSAQKMLPEEIEYKEKLKNFIVSRRLEGLSDLLGWSYNSLQKMFGNSKPQVKFTKQYLVVFHWVLKQKKKELESLIDDIEGYLEF